ncbi:MAG TPA: hypothetical protein VF658_18335 [Pyrinomonadaceae bacterium]|jgi:hypothetical protein
MSKKKATTILPVLDGASQGVSRWDKAIADAEAMIKEEKNKISKLRRSIDAFRAFRDSGVPFPGEAESHAAQ